MFFRMTLGVCFHMWYTNVGGGSVGALLVVVVVLVGMKMMTRCNDALAPRDVAPVGRDVAPVVRNVQEYWRDTI